MVIHFDNDWIWQEREMDRRGWFSIILVLNSTALFSLRADAAEGAFTDFPFMVYCENGGIDRAFYLAKIDPDGIAVYISPDNLAGTITLDGPAAPVGGEWAGSCAGKTLDELRAAGQAFDLH
jgi:hypothetical protein